MASSVTHVVRPIVRSFKAKWTSEAVKHVARGGHAIVWETPSRARIYFPTPKKGDIGDLGAWSAHDLGRTRWTKVTSGPFKGKGSTVVPSDCVEIVKRRAERDSIFPGAVREIAFDCLECGACCRDNEVILDPKDVKRLQKGGFGAFTKAPYAKKKDGRIVLTLLPSKRCRHLAKDNTCGVYVARPDSCSSFPVGSECCLYAREEEFGWVDGFREKTKRGVKQKVVQL